MKVSAVLIAATTLVAGVAANYATVKTDVNKIKTDVAKLYQALKTSDGTSYNSAIAIDSAARALNADLQTANTDAKAVSSLSSAQAQALLTILSNTYTNVSLISKRLITLEPKFKSIGVAGAAKMDISAIASSTKTFGATLVSKAPSASKSSASALAAKYNKALASALAAYRND
ncbi:unnamed protein product [Tilletia controversa]|uniref:Hydrophobic surface binding protein A n=2 Tax=Tilletia TaxID=13289 RepID=A0A8X7SSY0_9BASI|nr:hypothetical protein CF336_g8290 [Tilletia laevis]KAE8183995.1 hypothetical protein CF328_g8005 [Tilletia controversa]KAE8243165.1 hypothetical protein A4X03_0g7850 [Tilletia caries]KAE8184772.1 hypothetical protein CF335_g7924 [Tilletia laevis]KAE8238628.1 hypothetical protein A4X06_0g8685 [Tilletia controversa]